MNEATSTFFAASRVYDPVALFRTEEDAVVVVRTGPGASRRFMILTEDGRSAWPHEPFSSLSDVAWSLRAHGWHTATPQPVGDHARAAATLGRLLGERA